jgi:hypothetical protein
MSQGGVGSIARAWELANRFFFLLCGLDDELM